MPIYEYQCESCGQKFEKLRVMKDADLKIPCEQCHSPNTHRVLSTCFSRAEGGGYRSGSSSCSSCQGGSCSTCGH